MPTKELAPVNPQVADLMEKMNPRDIMLLILKILRPELPLHDLAKLVWTEVGYDSRRRYIANSGVSRVIEYLRTRPYQLGLLMNSKMMPLAIAALYEGLDSPKDNVRVTAAKEIIRLAQSTAGRLYPDENEPGLPAEELDEVLKEAQEVNEVTEDETEAGDSS